MPSFINIVSFESEFAVNLTVYLLHCKYGLKPHTYFYHLPNPNHKSDYLIIINNNKEAIYYFGNLCQVVRFMQRLILCHGIRAYHTI